jgi:hypothetical protein
MLGDGVVAQAPAPMHPPIRAQFWLFALAVGACTVPPAGYVGRACDGSHPCLAGYACSFAGVDGGATAGVCLAAGPDAGADDSCTGGQTRPCGNGKNVGECRKGAQACVAGHFGPCQGEVQSTDEVCDGKDNDCDGQTDNDLTPPPCALTLGVCAGSTKRCGGAAGWLDCTDEDYGKDYAAGVETRCDDLDNNCDGRTDEGLDNDRDGYGVLVACRNGAGDCDDWNATVHPGAPENCDGLDNNCNGQTDEGFFCGLWTENGSCTYSSCKVGGDIPGEQVCNSTCSAFVCQAPVEECDGADDNCDGQTDEGLTDLVNLSSAGLLAGPGSSDPVTAGLKNRGFTTAYLTANGIEMQVISEPGNKAITPDNNAGQVAVKVPDPDAALPIAVSASHLVYAASDGTRAVQLHEGWPAGSAFVLTADVPLSLAARDADSGTTWFAERSQGNHLAFGTILAGKLTGTALKMTSADAVHGVAVASLGNAPYVIWEAAPASGVSVLRAASASGASFGSPYELAPASLTNPREPVAAGEAIIFTAEDSKHVRCPYIASTKASQLATSDAVALHSTSSSPGTCGNGVSLPAVAALGSEVYLVAWLEEDKTLHSVRISWLGSAWSAQSAPTGLRDPSNPNAAIESSALACEGGQFLVLLGSVTGTAHQISARLDCPANF